ncbi:MAG: outer membrane protein assembly factor BamC [Methylococcaceae bacterium]|nr:outer membrane protein assembly factor BamC [Methylococcaceae bacterium]
MPFKKLIFSSALVLVTILLPACGGPDHLDVYQQLERPPQLEITPSTEVAAITDESVISNGLGNNIKLVGNKTAPLLKLNLEFDNTWQVLEKVLKHQKIAITDHDREQGQYLVNFDTDSYQTESGFFTGIGEKLFTESFGLRKYQLTVKQVGESTQIIAKDIGAITTEADREDGIEEVVDPKLKGPADSEFRLITALYKHLRDGFVEPEMRQRKGGLLN